VSLPDFEESARRPQTSELAALAVSIELATDTTGPAPVVHTFDRSGKLMETSALFLPELLPASVSRVPIWSTVRRARPDTAAWIVRVGGPDVVFEFHVRGAELELVGKQPSPYRVMPSAAVLERASSAMNAVFRTGVLIRRNDATDKWMTFMPTVGDDRTDAAAFSGICYPRCRLPSYSAACLADDVGRVEVGTPEHVFCFSRALGAPALVWHRVITRWPPPRPRKRPAR